MPDGTDLTKRGGRAAQARRGTDLTLSASKSFSIMATADPRLVALWDESVKIAAAVIEKEIVIARTGHGGSSVEQTGKAVLAAYRHEDTRVLEDGTPDPDLHTHVLAINATQRADGTWVRMDLAFGQKMVLAKTADFAQKAWLAQQVQKLGYEVRQTKDGWEFSAIPQEVLDAFSRRSKQIDDALRARGIDPDTATDSQKEAACLATRGSKSQASQSDQRWEWRDRLRESWLDMDKIVSEVDARGPIETPDLTHEAVASAARHLGERESVFSKNQTRLEALKAGMVSTTLTAVDSALADKAAGLIDVGGGKLTTRDTLYREQEILARAQAGHDQVAAILSTHDTQALIAKTEAAMGEGKSLSQGQRDAITLALTTADRTVGIVGAWGVGKTTGAVRPIVAQAKASGFHVIGMTPTTKAKKELADAKPDELMTIAAWLQTKPEMQSEGNSKRNDKRLIVMDEAAMVGAEDMDRVLQKLDREGGRLVLVGDPQQLRSVGAGAPYQQMMEARAIQFAKISEVQRQSDARLKKMAQVWADGDAKAAVTIAQEYMTAVTVKDSDWAAAGKAQETEKVSGAQREAGELKPSGSMVALAERHGLEDAADLSFQEVREYLDAHTEKVLGFDEDRGKDKAEAPKSSKVPRDVRQAALVRETASAYLSLSPEERADTVLMTGTNKLRAAINSQVRLGLKERGEIGAEFVTVRALDKTDMTKEALSHPESYQDRSDLIVRMSEGRGAKRRDVDWHVKGVQRGRVILENAAGEKKEWNPSTAKSPKVYSTREIDVSPGDEINFRDNAGLRNAHDRIENGADAKVVRLSPDGPIVQMEDGRQVTLRSDQSHPVDYGYCRTVHKAQGMTKGGAIYAVESVGQESISQVAGVACTREKASLRILTDDPEKTGKAMEKWAVHETAMAATKAARLVDLDTIQALRREAQAELGRHGDLSKAREQEPVELAQARRERDWEIER